MAELSLRNSSARVIRNVLAFTQDADFQQRLIIDLRNRSDHLENAWTRFNTNHDALVQTAQEGNLNAELAQHNQLYDEIETAYTHSTFRAT